MLIFISSPYAGDTETNMELARAYCRMAVDAGHTPIAPHLLFPQFMKEETERERALQMGLELLDLCDEVWSFGKPSAGMEKEIRYARKRFIPVCEFPAGRRNE